MMTQLFNSKPFQLMLMDVGVTVMAVTLMGAAMEAEEAMFFMNTHTHIHMCVTVL